MVPYRFGGDELTFGLPTVAVWDDGVDSFEIVNNLRETYENNWIFAGYWHQDLLTGRRTTATGSR